MRVLLQRVTSASVVVDGETTGAIDTGLLLFVGFGREDTEAKLAPMAEKVTQLRVFPNDAGKLHFSALDKGYGLLLVPQFTLYADTSRGRRPGFDPALTPAAATELFDAFVRCCRETGAARVETGIFGADMKVSLVNDGPLTIMLEA